MFKHSFFFRYLSPYTGVLLMNVLLRTLSALFTVFLLLGIAPLLSILFNTPETTPAKESVSYDVENNLLSFMEEWVSTSMQTNGAYTTLAYVIAGILILYFFKNLFSYLGLYFFTPIRNGVLESLRNDLYRRLLILPISFYSFHRKGDLLSRLSNDIQEIDENILKQIQQVLIDFLLFIFMLGALFFISPPLTLAVLIILPFAGLLIGSFSRSLRKISPQLQILVGSLGAQTEESIQGLKTIKSFNTIPYSTFTYQALNAKMTKLRTIVCRRTDLSSPLSEFIGTISIVVLLILGGFFILHSAGIASANMSANFGAIKATAFISFLVTLTQIINPAKNLATAYYSLKRGKASVRRVKDILYAEEKILEKENALPIQSFEDSIEFKNMSFGYANTLENEKEPKEFCYVLKNINLRIKKGSFIALVGASGAGKSSLVDLIPRFYDCSEGEVLLDGHSIKDYKIEDIRALSAVVSQDTILFNDSILNNINLGITGVKRDDVIHAATAAYADDFIMETDHGYDSMIGDGGTKLSGGQRQRLSIARALLKDAPILILDEATSALDTISEKMVQDALQNLSKDRTIIAIAHRLSTIRSADEIVVLEKGCIVERGTHEELVAKQGVYYKLYGMS
ncbi:MAG: ABC transporter ATP-binding protein [Bacteroidales bacterium]